MEDYLNGSSNITWSVSVQSVHQLTPSCSWLWPPVPSCQLGGPRDTNWQGSCNLQMLVSIVCLQTMSIILYLDGSIWSNFARDVNALVQFTVLPLLITEGRVGRHDGDPVEGEHVVIREDDLARLNDLLHFTQHCSTRHSPSHWRQQWRSDWRIGGGGWHIARVDGLYVEDVGQIILRILSTTVSSLLPSTRKPINTSNDAEYQECDQAQRC